MSENYVAHASEESSNAADMSAREMNRRAMLLGTAAVSITLLASCGGGGSTSSGVTVVPSSAPTPVPTPTPAPSTTANLPSSLQSLLGEWKASPETHDHMGDFRRVGYKRGKVPLPTSGSTVVLASSLGILPNTGVNVYPQIKAALDNLGDSGGGELRLDAGTYQIDTPIVINRSNVILSGAGSNKTILSATNTLHGAFDSPTAKSINGSYSYTGGQVMFNSPGRNPGSSGWNTGGTLANVTAPLTRGTYLVPVDSSASITVGQMVLLQIRNTTPTPLNAIPTPNDLLIEASGKVEGSYTFIYGGKNGASPQTVPPGNVSATQLSNGITYQWPVMVTAIVSATQIQIEQPVKLSTTAQSTVTIVSLGNTVHDSGVRGLTIDNKLIPQGAHDSTDLVNGVFGSNGVSFEGVYDCWCDDIHVTNADVNFSCTTGCHCTFQNISSSGRASHHFTIFREGSHDNLVQDFVINDFTIPLRGGSTPAYFHGISCEWFASGNVWRRGTMNVGTFDSHRRMPFENLRTNITLVNKVGSPGGAFTAGPQYGTRWTHWGIDVQPGGNTICMEVTDVAPKCIMAGITGLPSPSTGSQLQGVPSGVGLTPGANTSYFTGDRQGLNLEFGTDLGQSRDLLDIQRALAPVT